MIFVFTYFMYIERWSTIPVWTSAFLAYFYLRFNFRYMYAGKIENLNTRSPRLLEAADKYQLSELKEICEVNIFEIGVSNTILRKIIDRLNTLHTINFKTH